MAANETTDLVNAPGVPNDRPVTGLAKWEGKHELAEELIKCIPGVKTACVQKGSRGRPIDSIRVTVDHGVHPEEKHKLLVKTIEVLLSNVLNLIVDFRTIVIR